MREDRTELIPFATSNKTLRWKKNFKMQRGDLQQQDHQMRYAVAQVLKNSGFQILILKQSTPFWVAL